MSCGKIDDLQDLASNLFDFGDDQPQRPARERGLKKQRKPKTNPQSTNLQQKEQEGLVEHVIVDKPLGTHSIYVKTFGCSHNISDSEFMVGQLSEYGYKIVDNANQADLVLINSCTVVNPSQDAFISMVCKAKKIKKPLVVAGCVPQGDANIPQIADISAVGVTQIDRIVEVVEQTLKGHKVQLLHKKQLPSLDLPKIRKNKDIQIIAINAGCLGACTYCKTVFARGKLLSYTSQSIINRVKAVVKEGVKEVWLTSEDTGAYGRDLNTNISQLLVSLCEQLKNHNGIMMRIGMTNPPYMLDQLSSIAHFLNHPRVFSFIHIPIQAGHNNVLEKMNREYTVEEFRQVADFFLKHVPDVTIATDIICGFPEETDEEFEASLKLIDQYRFRVVNINQFYLRPGTPAANYKQLPTKVVKSRSSKLTELFKSFNKHGYMVGRIQRVWINEFQTHKGEKFLVGHTKNYTKVIIPFTEQLLYKQVMMRITHAYDWHVEGDIIDENAPIVEIDPAYVENMKRDIIEQRQRIKLRKQEKMIKIKQKLKMQQEKSQQDKLQRSKQVSIDDANNEKSCCSGGGCTCATTGCSCGKNSCATQKQQVKTMIQQPSLVQQSKIQELKSEVKAEMKPQISIKIEKTQQKQQIQTKTVHNPLYLILAAVFILLGFGLLAME